MAALVFRIRRYGNSSLIIIHLSQLSVFGNTMIVDHLWNCQLFHYLLHSIWSCVLNNLYRMKSSRWKHRGRAFKQAAIVIIKGMNTSSSEWLVTAKRKKNWSCIENGVPPKLARFCRTHGAWSRDLFLWRISWLLLLTPFGKDRESKNWRTKLSLKLSKRLVKNHGLSSSRWTNY